ncbi:MAG: GNAT family N-acetyltransferase [Ilumatobacteraceae bacterium]
MTDDGELERVQAVWRELTTARHGFAEHDVCLAETDSHRAAPDGWVAVVRIGHRAVVAGPAAQLDRISDDARRSSPVQLVDRDFVRRHFRPLHTLGPARLYYGSPTVPVPAGRTIGPLELSDSRVQAVLADASQAERDEAGVGHTTSGIFVALDADGVPISVCAWTLWPGDVAHISSLTAAAHRGCGAGLAAAHRALTEAAARGLLPQWRVAHWNAASIGLAQRLGLRHLGDQYSIRLDEARSGSPDQSEETGTSLR